MLSVFPRTPSFNVVVHLAFAGLSCKNLFVRHNIEIEGSEGRQYTHVGCLLKVAVGKNGKLISSDVDGLSNIMCV